MSLKFEEPCSDLEDECDCGNPNPCYCEDCDGCEECCECE